MTLHPNHPTPARSIGRVTTSSTAGAGLGAALSQIIIHLVPSLGPVEAAVSVVLTVLLGLLGGYLVPPTKPAIVTDTPNPDVFDGQANVEEGERVAVPDYHATAVEPDYPEEAPRVVEHGYGPTNGSTPVRTGHA